MNIFYRILIALFFSGTISYASIIIFYKETMNYLYSNEMSLAVVLFVWFLGAALMASFFFKKFFFGKKASYLFAAVSITPVINAFVIVIGMIVIRFFGSAAGTGNEIGIWSTAGILLLAAAPAGAASALVYMGLMEMLRLEGVGRQGKTGLLIHAAGGLAISLIYSLFIAEKATLLDMAYWIGLINIVAVYIIYREKDKQGKVVMAISVVGLILFLIPTFSGNAAKIDKALNRMYFKGYTVVESMEHAFSKVTFAKKEDVNYIFSGRNQRYPGKAGTFEGMSDILTGEKILIINGGITGILQELIKNKKYKEIVYIETDIAAGIMTEKYFKDILKDDSRVKLIFGDAVVYLRSLDDSVKFDSVYVHETNDNTLYSYRFASKEFHELVKKVYSGKGVIVSGDEKGPILGNMPFKDKDIFDIKSRKNSVLIVVLGVLIGLVIKVMFPVKNKAFKIKEPLVLAGMAAASVMLMAATVMMFQGVYGQVYKNIGIIFSFFLLGNMIGALAAYAMEEEIKPLFVSVAGIIISLIMVIYVYKFSGFTVPVNSNGIIFFIIISGVLLGASSMISLRRSDTVVIHGYETIGMATGALAVFVILPLAGVIGLIASGCAVLLSVSAVQLWRKK